MDRESKLVWIMKIYFDGGCRPNPGQMSACIVMVHDNGSAEPMKLYDLGYGTNNMAEWSALVWAALASRDFGFDRVVFIGDSQLVINQASMRWKINDQNLSSFFQEFKEITKGFDFELCHVPRERNLAGRYLEKGCL